jgi:hypothetical protein
MVLVPMPRDIDTPANPHALVFHYMVEETLQRGEAAGPARDPAM